MSVARRLLAEAESRGVQIFERNGTLKVAYRGPAPADFLARLRVAKEQVVLELSGKEGESPALSSREAAAQRVACLLDRIAAENERRCNWWQEPVEAGRQRCLEIRSAATCEATVIHFQSKRSNRE